MSAVSESTALSSLRISQRIGVGLMDERASLHQYRHRGVALRPKTHVGNGAASERIDDLVKYNESDKEQVTTKHRWGLFDERHRQWNMNIPTKHKGNF